MFVCVLEFLHILLQLRKCKICVHQDLHLSFCTELISPDSQMQFVMDAETCICSARFQTSMKKEQSSSRGKCDEEVTQL